MDEKIELTGVEQSAYWWTNRLKYMAREIYLRRESGEQYVSDNEMDFLKLFYYYTDKEWRQLYLKLTEHISEDVRKYIRVKNDRRTDAFSQSTEKGEHNKLNSELAEILGIDVFPDIRLADSGYKDEVVFVENDSSRIWYKSCGINDLPKIYEARYIISGNEKELDIYNLFLATTCVLWKADSNFDRTNLFRKAFCEEYIKLNDPEGNKEEIKNIFNKCFEIAGEVGFISGRFWRNSYSVYLRNYDVAGIDAKYWDLANIFAEKILSQPEYLELKEQQPNV